MSWIATGLGGRAVALGASVAVHAAGALVAFSGGHPSLAAPSPQRGPAVEIAIDVTPPAPEAPLENARGAAPGAPHAHLHSHTHPYPVPADHDRHPHDPSIVHVAHAPAPPESHDEPAAAPDAVATPAPTAHFTMAIAPGAIAFGAVSAAGTGRGAVGADHDDDAPVAAASVTVPAKRIDAPLGAYPAEARRAGIEADVPVEIVVDTRGLVADARPLRHVGYGLDDAAVATVRRWRFTPAQKDGRLVRVRMTCDVSFRFE